MLTGTKKMGWQAQEWLQLSESRTNVVPWWKKIPSLSPTLPYTACPALLLCFLIGTHPRHHPNQKWQPVLCLLSFLWLLHDEEVFERLMARILNDRNIPCQETQQTGKGYPTQGKRKGRGFAESSPSSLPLRSLLWLLLHRVGHHPCTPARLITLWVTWGHSVSRWSGHHHHHHHHQHHHHNRPVV